MAVEITDIGDLLNATLEDIEKDNVAQTFEYPEYGLTEYFFGEKPKSTNGTTLEFDIRARASDNARFVGLFESTPAHEADLMVKGTAPWCHIETKVSWDELEIAMNSNEARVYDMLEERWNGARENNANLVEEALPLMPTNASATKQCRGLLDHIRTLTVGSSDPVGGFNGITGIYQDASTTTTWCGLDRNLPENSRLRNWVATYSGEMDQELIKALRKAMNRTKFNGVSGIKKKSGNDLAIAWGLGRHELYEDAVNRRAVESTKDDLAPITTTRFRGANLIKVPVFDSLAFDPIMGLKKSALQMRLLDGRWMERKKAINSRGQAGVWSVPVVSSFGFRPVNPRELFILHKVRA